MQEENDSMDSSIAMLYTIIIVSVLLYTPHACVARGKAIALSICHLLSAQKSPDLVI